MLTQDLCLVSTHMEKSYEKLFLITILEVMLNYDYYISGLKSPLIENKLFLNDSLFFQLKFFK
jgi:hypothetical protein